jgi:hypothetical protein
VRGGFAGAARPFAAGGEELEAWTFFRTIEGVDGVSLGFFRVAMASRDIGFDGTPCRDGTGPR